MGRPLTLNSRGRELLVAHEPEGRASPVWLAHTVLELLAEAGQVQPLVDASSSTWACNRAIPLEKQAAQYTGDGEASDIPEDYSLRGEP